MYHLDQTISTIFAVLERLSVLYHTLLQYFAGFVPGGAGLEETFESFGFGREPWVIGGIDEVLAKRL